LQSVHDRKVTSRDLKVKSHSTIVSRLCNFLFEFFTPIVIKYDSSTLQIKHNNVNMIMLRYGYQNSNLFFQFFLITVCSCFSALSTASNFASFLMHTHTHARARTRARVHTHVHMRTHQMQHIFFSVFLACGHSFLKKKTFSTNSIHSLSLSRTSAGTNTDTCTFTDTHTHRCLDCLVVGVFFFTIVSFFSSFTAAKTRPTPTLFRPQNHTHTLTCWMHHL